MIRWLGLSRSEGTEAHPGLLMIQIDGLSRRQLEDALDHQRMPFLASLIHGEGYRLHTLYSGQPASTPAVQGELFFGVKGAVPAFSFYNRAKARVFTMFDRGAVTVVQEALKKQDAGLLQGGGAYSNIFSAGSDEAHFCPEFFGWEHLKKAIRPLVLLSSLLMHGLSLLRTAVLIVLEIVLAVIDFFHGLIAGRDMLKELKFVPTRVAISILLRDLVAIGATVDVLRGLPVVHLNFIGYDEQAHRRGPSSRFAHWSLKGIDDTIRRLVHSARRSQRRDYDVWVYSDHGQESCIPYPVETGTTIRQAVARVFGEGGGVKKYTIQESRGIQFDRSKWLGGSFFTWLIGEEKTDETGIGTGPLVTAMGSVGHLYTSDPMDEKEKDRRARQLVSEAGVPLVLAAAPEGSARAWTPSGLYSLPEDAGPVLGPNHPFLGEVAVDLAALCHHPDAGDLVLSGWRFDKPPLSFSMENGSHAGPGSEETRAFALLPISAPLALEDKDHLRPLDLREAAQRFLGRASAPARQRARRESSEGVLLRVMTYNVHHCRTMDGKLSPARIAKVISNYNPDIVALQELDVGRARTQKIDQAHFIARELEMEFHFSPALYLEEGKYGNAILSRFPMQLVHAGALPTLAGIPGLEPRGALWAKIEVDGRVVHVFNTHFGLRRKERLLQAEALTSGEWLGNPDRAGPTIVCGDFNSLPYSTICKKIRRGFRDVQVAMNDHRPQRTFTGLYPVGRIDHIFISPGIAIRSVEVPRTSLTLRASDHLPLIADISLPES
jgi:endonuclease/exonuclease/phosphatase family metal-dependent hydrolase